MEFFDWVFLTQEEQENRQFEETKQKEAIQSEMDKIQRSLNYIGTDNTSQANGFEAQSMDVYQELPTSTVQSKATNVITSNQAQIDEIAKLLASV